MKKVTTIMIALILLCACPAFAGKDIYSWVDENGVKHFSDQKPDNDIKYDTTKAITSSQEPEKLRPGYISMAEEAKELVRQNELEIEQEKIRRAEEEKRNEEKKKLEEKIAELSKEVDEMKNRPIEYYTGYPIIGRGHARGHKPSHDRKANFLKNQHSERHNEERHAEPEKYNIKP